MTLTPLPRVWRPLRARVVTLTMAAAVLGGAVAVAVAIPPPWSLGDRAGIVLVALLVVGVILLLGRPAVRADADGLTVTNMLTTRRLVWAQVVAIRLGRDDSWASLDLSDGTTLPVMGVQVSDGERARQAFRELSELIDAHGAEEGIPPA